MASLHQAAIDRSVPSSLSFLSSQAELEAVDDPGTVRTMRVAGLRLSDVKMGILHRSGGLLAVNKPADVRLDGAFDLTLEKLLSVRASAPSLQGRWEKAHQLDFATSGVIALTGSPALATATQTLFDRRHTKKQYLALVHGHLTAPPVRNGVTSLVDYESLDAIADSLGKKQKGGAGGASPKPAESDFVVRSRAVAAVRTAMLWFREASALLPKLADGSDGGNSRSAELSRLLSLGWKDFKAEAGAGRTALGEAAPPLPVVGALAASYATEPPACGLDPTAYLAAQLAGLLSATDAAAAGASEPTVAAADIPTSSVQLPLSARLFDLFTATEALDTARYRVEQAAATAAKAAEKDAAAAAAVSAGAADGAAVGGSGCAVESPASAASASSLAGALADFAIAPATDAPLSPPELASLRKPRFFIDLPVADLPGDFRMGIEGEHVGARDGRPAQTLVQVLGHGYWAVPAALLEGSRAALAALEGGAKTAPPACASAPATAAASASVGAHSAASPVAEASSCSAADGDDRLVYQPVTKLLLQPITGRRHQLRVHLRACGYAIVGDVTYAKTDHDKPRMMLHAWRLQLQYPIKKPATGGKGGRGRGGRGGAPQSVSGEARRPLAAGAEATSDALPQGAAVGGAGAASLDAGATHAAAAASNAPALPEPAAAAVARVDARAGAPASAAAVDDTSCVPSGPLGIESPDPFTPAELAILVRECGIACAPAGEPTVVAADAAAWPGEAGLLLAGDAARPAGELVPPLHS